MSIYDDYVQLFRSGAFDYIREDLDQETGRMVPKRYFSGGNDLSFVRKKIKRVPPSEFFERPNPQYVGADTDINPVQSSDLNSDRSMLGQSNANTIRKLFGDKISNERISVVNVKGEQGSRQIPIRYARSYTIDDRKIPFKISKLKSLLKRAIAEIQEERSDFDLSLINGVSIEEKYFDKTVKKADIVELPVEVVLTLDNLDDNRDNIVGILKNELFKVALFYEQAEAQGKVGEDLTQSTLEYVANLKPRGPRIPYYPNAPPVDYKIIVPVYNEERLLDEVLNRIKNMGYLDRVTFVNDGSTDKTREVLDQWRTSDQISVIHLNQNRKKEGAIRYAMEKFKKEGVLTDKIILLDFDSFLSPADEGEGSLDDMVAQASMHMDQENIVGMAFRYDIMMPENPSFMQKTQYSEFAGLRFFNKLAPQQHQLWVIIGRGGIFRSEELLTVLQGLVRPDFETGDLQITVDLMKAGHKVAYFDKLKVQTIDVNSIPSYFKQRRRWERGTLKVFVNEWGYYSQEIKNLSKIGMHSILHVFLRLLVPVGYSLAILSPDVGVEEFIKYHIPLIMGFWTVLSGLITISDPDVRKELSKAKSMLWAFYTSIIYFFITTPATFTGLYDAIKYFAKGEHQDKNKLFNARSKIENDEGMIVNDGIQSETMPGGIDLNPEYIRKQVNKQIEYDANLSLDLSEDVAMHGVRIQINDIVPVTNLKPFIKN